VRRHVIVPIPLSVGIRVARTLNSEEQTSNRWQYEEDFIIWLYNQRFVDLILKKGLKNAANHRIVYNG